MQATRKTYAGLFLVTLATLMFQMLLTRIFSVTLWYHFAFVAVSIGMFGMTVGALVVYLRPERFAPERVSRQLATGALLFAASMVASFLAYLVLPFVTGTGSFVPLRGLGPASGGGLLSMLAYLGGTYLVISVPFICSGVVVCLALTRFPSQVPRLYAADLLGAALGCVLLIALLELTDGPTAVVAVAALASAAALCFALDAGGRRLVLAAVVLCVVFGGFALGHTLLVRRGTPLLRLFFVKGTQRSAPVYERWNAFSYFQVCCQPALPSEPFGWGFAPRYRPTGRIRQLSLGIDAWALTVLTEFDGDLGRLDYLRHDVTNLAHQLREGADVLVVGVGGGRDVLAALAFGQRSVVGVEINGDLLDALNGEFGDFTGHLDRDPRVRFVEDEARSWVARQHERFDLIQVSLIDTFAASAAGAFALTENALYTVEGWLVFLEQLHPDGLLSFSRWYNPEQPAELERLVALASAALRARGVERPQQHLAVLANVSPEQRGTLGVGTLLASPKPLSASDRERLRSVAGRLGLSVLLAPDGPGDPTLVRIAASPDLAALAREFPLDISPPTDDRPFFFHMLRLRDLLHRERSRGVQNPFNLTAVTTLGALLVIVTLLTGLCVLVPLALTHRRVLLRGSLPFFVFFAGIGLGFMFVEISQLQRLILFLGHPTYGLSVVLFSLLLSSGIGSALTPPVPSPTAARAARWRLFALLAALVAFGLLAAPVSSTLRSASTPVRVTAAVALLFPLGLFLGMAFPLGMGLAARRNPTLLPWLWGINGATSVCASVAAVAVALAAGIGASFWCGVVCYAVAVAAFLRLTGGAAR